MGTRNSHPFEMQPTVLSASTMENLETEEPRASPQTAAVLLAEPWGIYGHCALKRLHTCRLLRTADAMFSFSPSPFSSMVDFEINESYSKEISMINRPFDSRGSPPGAIDKACTETNYGNKGQCWTETTKKSTENLKCHQGLGMWLSWSSVCLACSKL